MKLTPDQIEVMNEIGNKYGKISVLNKTERSGYYLVRCDCGEQFTSRVNSIKYSTKLGATAHCKLCERKSKIKHNLSQTRVYEIYKLMMRRCYDEANKSYPNYGARGIEVCANWHDIVVFNEWALSSGYADTLTLERIDVNGDYTPENCTWITKKQQSYNRTNSRLLTAFGKTQTLAEWSEEYTIGHSTILHRLKSGWNTEQAISKEVKRK